VVLSELEEVLRAVVVVVLQETHMVETLVRVIKANLVDLEVQVTEAVAVEVL
jgi:hypothetical protein